MSKNAKPLLISALIALVVLAGAYILNLSFLGFAWILIGTLLIVSIALIAILAGFVVVKTLFLIAAELSLLIFLAQSYCGSGGRSIAGDDAMRSLILLGLIYIAVAFVQSLYSVLRERYDKTGESGWTFRKITITTVFLVFTGLFLYEIYLVMLPIVLGLCVYR